MWHSAGKSPNFIRAASTGAGAATELDHDMLEIIFIVFALTVVLGLGIIAVRVVVSRLIEMRNSRLRSHLDWVNPQVVTGYRRLKNRR